MTPENFCYWLHGYIELENPGKISAEKTQVIKDHLNLVFKKETPVRSGLKHVNKNEDVFVGDSMKYFDYPLAIYNGEHFASC